MNKYFFLILTILIGCGNDSSTTSEVTDHSQNQNSQIKCVEDSKCKNVCKNRHPYQALPTNCASRGISCADTGYYYYTGDYSGYQKCVSLSKDKAIDGDY